VRGERRERGEGRELEVSGAGSEATQQSEAEMGLEIMGGVVLGVILAVALIVRFVKKNR
jgi:hypothetical protein